MKRIDLYALMVGDIFLEKSPWPFHGDYKAYQMVGREEGDLTYVLAREISSSNKIGKVVKFFYTDEKYAPVLFLRTAVNALSRVFEDDD